MANLHRPTPEPDDDDTIRLLPPRKPQSMLTSRRAWLAGAGILGTACLLRGASLLLESPQPARVASAPPAPRVQPPPTVAPAPVPAAPEFAIRHATEQEILHNVPTGLTIFRFADDRRILVLDFASLYQQGMTLNRVAALIEKAGAPHNHVLSEPELLKAIRADGSTMSNYYYGHDYSAASLRRFFALVDAERIPLDPEEQQLRDLLDQVGWFKPDVQGGLISIPAVGSDRNVTLSARRAILHHELSHGMFFSDADYAGFVHDFWNVALTAQERANVRRFLGSEGYDTRLEELMYNEMQAYLMFTYDPMFFSAEMIGMAPRRLAALQAAFLAGMPTGWLSNALAATPLAVPVEPGRMHRAERGGMRLHAA